MGKDTTKARAANYENEVFYQIYPRSFKDSNGDGIGDIPGIISKLDYLKDLGVDVLWLSPVYKTGNADFGYDVADYMDINPEYGTMEDMDLLIAEARKRGLKIVMDLVVNHTSSLHPWFIDSKKEKSKYHDFYFWREGKNGNKTPPNNWMSQFGGPAWTFDEKVGQWYLHLFTPSQPDLNWRNPLVLKEVEKIIEFWLKKGIYGFRCDVINQIWKESLNDGKRAFWFVGREHYLSKDGNHKILKRLYEDVFSKYDAVAIGETGGLTIEEFKRFRDGELDLCFQFDTVNSDHWRKVPVIRKLRKTHHFKKTLLNWAVNVDWNSVFLENHDQIRSIGRWGTIGKNRDKAGMMLGTLLLSLRGTPFIYQGEELGMADYPLFEPKEYQDPVNHNLYGILKKLRFSDKKAKKLVQRLNRDNARLPMQWDGTASSGFSTASSTWLPTNPDYENWNAEKEEKDPWSILSYYKRLLKFRKEDEAFRKGTFRYRKTRSSIFAFIRELNGVKRLVIVNLTNRKKSTPRWMKKERGQVLLSNYEGAGYTYKKALRPYEALIIEME